MQPSILIEGILFGFATGATCLASCAPIYLPYLLTEDRKIRSSIVTVLEISAGRFFSYLSFGALAGFTSSAISGTNRSLYTSIAYILLSAYLLLTTYRTHNEHKKCAVPKIAKISKSAFVLGILTGINFCPSFLIALSRVLDLGGVINGMLLFFGFFISTSLFLMPLAFVNVLTKIHIIKKYARYAALIIAVVYTAMGVIGLFKWFNPAPAPNFKEQVSVFETERDLVITASIETDYIKNLQTAISEESGKKVTMISESDFSKIADLKNAVIFVDSTQEKKILSILNESSYIIVVEENYPIETIKQQLHRYAFGINDDTSGVIFRFTGD